MTDYRITPTEDGAAVELSGVGANQQLLLDGFGECQSGQCTCPTAEYEKVEAMDLETTGDGMAIRLRAKPGRQFDTEQIAACVDYTLSKG